MVIEPLGGSSRLITGGLYTYKWNKPRNRGPTGKVINHLLGGMILQA